MIRHIVLTKFRDDVPEEQIAGIYDGLAALVDTLPGARRFTGGRSTSPEEIERGYLHAFTIDFASWDDLKTYADHPDHRALGSKIVERAEGGVDGLIVLDIEV